jgi:Ca2+-binding RTX toxin-like protein
MNSPNIGELLTQSKITNYSFDIVLRAINTLYGYIGSGLDERNWMSIMASKNALESAEAALINMYQSESYLLRNAAHLKTQGYSVNAIELTYRQISAELQINYSNNWSKGTDYETAGKLSFTDLQTQLVVGKNPTPSISVAEGPQGYTITLSQAGEVFMSVTGSIGNFAEGDTLLTEQPNISIGTISVTSNSLKTSSATAETYVLGTTGNDTINTIPAGARADHIFGGSGDDTISTGDGADYVVAGDGADTVNLGDGNDTIIAGMSWDTITGGVGTDSLFLDSGRDEQETVVINIINGDGGDIIDGFKFGGGLGGFGFDEMDLTVPVGLQRINLGDSLTDRINDGTGTAGAYIADAPAGQLDRTLHVIAGDDILGDGTTIDNSVARAQIQFSDGANDFLGLAFGAANSAFALLTDNGTNYFLFLVIDLNANQVTDLADITLIAMFTNPDNIGAITMIDFNTAAG